MTNVIEEKPRSNYNIIARFQGGPNAGHTLVFNGKKHVLHTIPSGIFHEDAMNLVGNGVVIDPVIFKKELDNLSKFEGDFRGQRLKDKGSKFDPAEVRQITLELVDKKAGVFELQVDWIRTYGASKSGQTDRSAALQ